MRGFYRALLLVSVLGSPLACGGGSVADDVEALVAEAHAAGFQQGEAKGFEEGKEAGENEGYARGLDDGFKKHWPNPTRAESEPWVQLASLVVKWAAHLKVIGVLAVFIFVLTSMGKSVEVVAKLLASAAGLLVVILLGSLPGNDGISDFVVRWMLTPGVSSTGALVAIGVGATGVCTLYQVVRHLTLRRRTSPLRFQVLCVLFASTLLTAYLPFAWKMTQVPDLFAYPAFFFSGGVLLGGVLYLMSLIVRDHEGDWQQILGSFQRKGP